MRKYFNLDVTLYDPLTTYVREIQIKVNKKRILTALIRETMNWDNDNLRMFFSVSYASRAWW